MMPFRTPKSKRGAMRQFNAIIREYKRRFAGGGAFGWDWPTFRANWPEAHNHCQAMKAIYPLLPE